MATALKIPETPALDDELRASALVSHDAVRSLLGGVGKLKLRQMEADGRFPKRMYITPRQPVWRRGEILDYLRDPENWQPSAA